MNLNICLQNKPNNNLHLIGEKKMKIKEIRLKHNMLQNDVAQILDVKRNTYAMWELEHDIIPLNKLIIFSNYFKVSLDYLLELSDINEYQNINSFNKEIYLKRLKDIRKERKMTQVVLAKKLNTTNSVISRYESGQTFILTSFLIEYSKIFNVSTDYILGLSNIKDLNIK